MRLKSSIYASALMRQAMGQGGFATVLNKGAEEAGAIFVSHLKARDVNDLYGPAPQAIFDADAGGERLFEKLLENADDIALSQALERQRSFDPDCWIVEIELGQELDFLPVVNDQSEG